MSQHTKRKGSVEQDGARKRKKPTPNLKSKVNGTPIKGIDLVWKEVAISNRLDDAEGFYGLEEISDVEVVKDESSGTVHFLSTSGKIQASSANDEVHEEWSGFDEDVTDPDGDMSVDNDEVEVQDTRVANSSPDDSRSQMLSVPPSLDEDIGFALLSSEAQDNEVDMSAWQVLQLPEALVDAISALNFSAPTQIQAKAIPFIMQGRDVIGKAVTGSGKTLAFGIPILGHWLDACLNVQNTNNLKAATALILAPTRELAHQITKHIAAVCENMSKAPRLATVTGGLSILKQQRQLEKADIVVATPGRLWEVISDSAPLLQRLKDIKFLVVDEADRLLSEGHFKEVEDIIDALDRQEFDEEDKEVEVKQSSESCIRQTLVFSATFHKELQRKLASKSKQPRDKKTNPAFDRKSMEYLMHKLPFQEKEIPAFVDVNPDSQMAEKLSETIIECKATEKDLYLYSYLLQEQHNRKKKVVNGTTARILVFTNSVSAVKRLVPLLQALNLPSTSVSPLHSNMPQKSRLRSLEKFAGDSANVNQLSMSLLIATDVAARGLDIKGVTTIVHYHVPRSADMYIHRSGRTARVDASGNSVLICSPDETAGVTKLVTSVHGSAATSSMKAMSRFVDRIYLPNDLLRQVQKRIDLAQKIIESTQNKEKTNTEENWLRNAANDLGVDYDSEEFEIASKQGRRGRGGEKERRQKKDAKAEGTKYKTAQWKAQLREELENRIDFGDSVYRSMKYLAGGAFDVDQLLAERTAM